MNARSVVKRANRAMRTRIEEHVWCEHWRANIAMTLLSAVSTAFMLRWFVGLYVGFLRDSWAGGLVMHAWLMTDKAFYLTVGMAALGGVVSLLHELRKSVERFNFLSAVGHMFAAQFAGLLTYLMCIEYSAPVPLAVAACGLAGWGGNRTIEMINDRVINRVFPQDKP